LIYNYPPAAISMLFFLLSLAGVPLTAGFFAKFFIFAAAVEQQMWWLVAVGAINVVIAAFYYFRIIKAMFMREGEDRVLWDVPKLQRWTMALTLVLVVFLIPLFMKYVYIYAANAEFLNYKEFLQKFPQ
jgi:NADH-quinone oxidoreductase subunit N